MTRHGNLTADPNGIALHQNQYGANIDPLLAAQASNGMTNDLPPSPGP